VTLGILLGYVVGKPVGVIGGTWLTTRAARGRLHPPVGWGAITAGGTLAGVGFTVALLISDLAFEGDEAMQEVAKTAVLVGSVLAAALAAVSLRRRTRARLRD